MTSRVTPDPGSASSDGATSGRREQYENFYESLLILESKFGHSDGEVVLSSSAGQEGRGQSLIADCF